MDANDTRLGTVIGGIARDLVAVLAPGDVASLRRLRPGDPGCAAFWRLVATRLEPADLLPGEAAARLEAERRWGVILAGMARMQGLHQFRARLGVTLAEADVSELRFLRLLRAHDESLADAVRVTSHTLAAKAKPVDWFDLARLVLSDGRADEDEVRRHIARDFYQAERR